MTTCSCQDRDRLVPYCSICTPREAKLPEPSKPSHKTYEVWVMTDGQDPQPSQLVGKLFSYEGAVNYCVLNPGCDIVRNNRLVSW